jgi:hypothetical protein
MLRPQPEITMSLKRCITCGNELKDPSDMCPVCCFEAHKIENPFQYNLRETLPSEPMNLWKAISISILVFGLFILLIYQNSVFPLIIIILGVVGLLATYQSEDKKKPRLEFRAVCPHCQETIEVELTKSSSYVERPIEIRYGKKIRRFDWKINKSFVSCSSCGGNITVPKDEQPYL